MTQTIHTPTTRNGYQKAAPVNPQDAAFDRCINFLVRMIEKYGYSLQLENLTTPFFHP